MAARKGLGKGLGKGIDSLIPQNTADKNKSAQKITEGNNGDNNRGDNGGVKENDAAKSVAIMLDINMIEPNRDQPRKSFEEDSLEDLAASMREYGVIEPLIVQKYDGYYGIIAGERRWRAAKKAGIKELPVVVCDYSEQQILEIALIENIQREDLNPIEEALAYQRLVKEYNLKQDEVAERVSKSRAAVTNSMRLLKLDERVQKMLIDDMISAGHARALLAIEDGEKQYNIAMRVFDEKLNVREIEKLIKDMGKQTPEKKTPSNDFVYREYEDKLKSFFGSKVVIHNRENNKGKIEIDYGSREEFERIMDLIEKK